MKQAIISIWIRKKVEPQGKFCYISGKPCYIANMTENKWFKNYSGYAIAKQILDKLPHGTKIIYKRTDLKMYYVTNKTRIYNKGIHGFWKDHQQVCLPIKQWEWKSGKPKEKYGLPTMQLSDWVKTKYKIVEDCSIPANLFCEAYRRAFKITT